MKNKKIIIILLIVALLLFLIISVFVYLKKDYAAYVKMHVSSNMICDTGEVYTGKLKKIPFGYIVEMYMQRITVAGLQEEKFLRMSIVNNKNDLQNLFEERKQDYPSQYNSFSISYYYIENGNEMDLSLDELGEKLF